MTVAAMPQTTTTVSGNTSRGPAGRQMLLAAAQFAKRTLNNPVLVQVLGGTLHQRVFEAMCQMFPELPHDVHFKILKAYVEWQLNADAPTEALPTHGADVGRNRPQSVAVRGEFLSDVQSLKYKLLELSVEAQWHILAHLQALSRGERVIGGFHPLARMLFKQSEETVKEIIEAMLIQARSATNPAA